MGVAIEANGVGVLANVAVGTTGGLLGSQLVSNPAATPQGVASAANAAGVITITGVAGQRVRLLHVTFGYTATAPGAGVGLLTITDGSVTLTFTCPASNAMMAPFLPPGGLAFAVGATVTLTVAAGGAGAVGLITTGSVIG